MKALITGASGFIGSTLIEQLSPLGFDVRALMRRSSSPAYLEGIKYKRIEGDLTDLDSLRKAVKDVDYVFHLAGLTAAPNRAAFYEHNAQGTARLAQAISEVRPGLTRFVYVSSLAAAGPAHSMQSPRTEGEESRPVSLYGMSKLQGEHELLKYKDIFPVTIVRPPMVYGPKDKGVFVVIKTISRNLMPILQGSSKEGEDGHKYYSSIHAQDLCRGIAQAAVSDKVVSGDVFYLSGDEIHTYHQFLSTIADCLNCDPLQFKVPKVALRVAALGLSAAGMITRKTFPFNLDKLNEVLPDYWICSNEKAKKILDFSPEFDLSAGMSHTIEWYKRQKWI